VAAQDISGRYRVEGVSPAGSAYTVTADIEMSADNTCGITYSDGDAGIYMVNGTTVTGAYVVHGKPRIIIYEIRGDGSLEGNFVEEFRGKRFIGKEKLTPVR